MANGLTEAPHTETFFLFKARRRRQDGWGWRIDISVLDIIETSIKFEKKMQLYILRYIRNNL